MSSVELVFVDDDPDDQDLICESLAKIEADHFIVLDSSCALLNVRVH